VVFTQQELEQRCDLQRALLEQGNYFQMPGDHDATVQGRRCDSEGATRWSHSSAAAAQGGDGRRVQGGRVVRSGAPPTEPAVPICWMWGQLAEAADCLGADMCVLLGGWV
jgi:hypothetical protein